MKKYSLFLVLFLLAAECNNPCKDVTCTNGTCVDGECVCDAGFSGDDCTYDLCDSIACVNGTCSAGACVCDENWGGTLCDDCDLNCGDHGSCNDAGDACVCDNGYTGADCSTPIAGGTCSNTCTWANDGACDDGGPGSEFSVCDCGTDCGDCGTRTTADCGSATDAAISVWFDGNSGSFPCNTQRIDVEIDGAFIGSLDSYFTSDPSCGDPGTVSIDLMSGTHSLYAECYDGDIAWGPGNYTVEPGFCLIISLSNNKISVKQVKVPISTMKK